MPDPTPLPAAARDAILDWYAVHGRTLAFRGTKDPYAILVSEAMAQQTQAARAGETWIRFMAAFPTAEALAAATPAAVLRAWQGLGYNRRALNLWRAARQIVAVHGGKVPVDLHALEALPGVGPYTARAVAAIAFGMPVGAVDTNVRRVLGRIVVGDVAALGPAALQSLADAAVACDRPGAWTHAVMDLGATVCRPRRPACAGCPARTWCRYAATEGASRPAAPQPAAPQPAAPQALADASDLHHAMRTPSAARAPVRFPATTRWLRGRIVDRLRAAMGDGWTEIDGPIGDHDRAAVTMALRALAREGLIELDPQERPEAPRRARLPIT